MISVKGASFGRFGGWRRRYPGGSECRSIFLTVSRAMPNRLAASRWLRPSTWQASRTRRYRPTVYILPPSISKKIEGYRWQSFTPPAAGKSRRFRGLICHRRSHQGYGVLRRAVPTWLNQPPNRAPIIAVHDAQPRDGGSGALYLCSESGAKKKAAGATRRRLPSQKATSDHYWMVTVTRRFCGSRTPSGVGTSKLDSPTPRPDKRPVAQAPFSRASRTLVTRRSESF